MSKATLKGEELKRLKALYSISEIAAKAESLEDLWDPLFSEILKIMNVDAGTLMIQEGNYLVRKVAKGLDPAIMKEPPIHVDKGGISWGVVKSKKPAVLTDLSKVEIASEIVRKGNFSAIVTVPMITKGQVLGVLSIFTRKEREFSQKDLDLLTTIANYAAVAIISIINTILLEENRRRVAELSAINEISKSISTLFDFEETLISILWVVVKLLRGTKGFFSLYDKKTGNLLVQPPAFDLSETQIKALSVKASSTSILAKAFYGGMPVLRNTLSQKAKRWLVKAKLPEIKSVIVSPLKVKSQTLGVLCVMSDKENNFKKEDIDLINILASSAAIVLNSAYMYREIEEAKEKDETLLSGIGEGVYAVDKDRKLILFNQSAEKITGYKSADILEKTCFSNLNFIDQKKESICQKRCPFLEAQKTKKPVTLTEDLFVKTPFGQLIPVSYNVAPVKDAEGNIIGGIAVFRDRTKELEVEQMKKELVSIASHELKTPITAIKGYLDMILEGDTGPVNEETKELLKDVILMNERLSKLVEDLLSVSRIEQGRIEIKPRRFDLLDSIKEVVDELKIKADERGLYLKYKKPKFKPEVIADPEKTRLVLTNLISNGIKFTLKGGVEVFLNKKDKEIIIQVKDTGVGLSKEAQKNLFNKFFRIRTAQTREVPGSGLGLYISKEILNLMNGKIWAKSKEGVGSTFSFSLPTRAT